MESKKLPKVFDYLLLESDEREQALSNKWLTSNSLVQTKPDTKTSKQDDDHSEIIENIKSIKSELAICKKHIENICMDLAERPKTKRTWINDIGAGFDVLQPIPIIIETYDDQVAISFPEIEVVAYGDNESEALLKFKEDISSLYIDLLGTPKDQLGKLPDSWLRILKKVIKKIG